MSFATRLKEARESKKLTQKKLADLVGVTNGAISNYEKNVSFPNIDILYKIFDILQIEPNFFFQDDINYTQKDIFTTSEKKLVLAYRNHPEMQAAINKMLDIEDVIIDDEAHNNSKSVEGDNTDYLYGYLAAKGQAPRLHKINKEKEAEAMEALRRLREKNK